MASSLNKYSNLALEASAGTGKTFQLAMRVAGMLLTGVAPRDILCLTFTKKATSEMKERIIKFINSMAENTASESEIEFITPLMKKYADMLQVEFSPAFIQQKAIEARNNLFAHFSELNIKTIDSFNNTILRIFPFEAGFRPDFNLESDEVIKQIKKDAFYNIISNILDDNIWKEILGKIHPVLEIQTLKFISKLQKYAEYTVDNILKLEKSIKHSKDKYEINQMLDDALKLQKDIPALCQSFMETFEPSTLNANQLKTYEKLKSNKIIELAKNNLIKEENLLLASSFKKYEFSPKQYDLQANIRQEIQKYYLLIGHIITSLALNLGSMLYEKVKEIKKAKNILTYSDISEEVYYMLSYEFSNIDRNYLYFRLDSKINHLLIDEFQDTSISQWLSLKPLAEEAMAGIGQHDKIGSFFYVGDPKQNIYRFRDGSSSLFRTLLNEYKDKLTSQTLDINYRSGSNIVEFVNNISQNIYATNKELFSIFNIHQKAAEKNGEGYVEVTYESDEKDAEYKYYQTYTLSKIEECLKAGYNYKDIAVLTVSNDHGGELIDYLESKNIPVQVETSASLTDSNVFKIITALAYFIETDDYFAYYTYAYSFPKALNLSQLEDAQNLKRDMARIKNYLENIKDFSIFEKILYLVDKLDLQNRFHSSPDLYAVIDIMESAAYGEKNINMFLEKVYNTAYDKQSLSTDNKNAVTVMTIHKSKGLQFPVVILPNLARSIKLDAGKTPLFISDNKEFGASSLCYSYKKDIKNFLQNTKAEEYMDKENQLILQDSINMLYVAMTRAEQSLFINCKPIKQEINDLSQYLSQFVLENIKKGTLKAVQKEEVKVKESIKINVEIEKEKSFGIEQAYFDDENKETLSYEATLFGSCLHAGLNMLDYNNASSLLAAQKHIKAHYGALLSENNMELITKHLHNVYNNKKWQELFKGRVFKERHIGINNSLYAVDIYSEFDDKIILMDYKTGHIDEKRMEEYSKKMRKYSSILEKVYNKKVETFIFHIETGEIILTK